MGILLSSIWELRSSSNEQKGTVWDKGFDFNLFASALLLSKVKCVLFLWYLVQACLYMKKPNQRLLLPRNYIAGKCG